MTGPRDRISRGRIRARAPPPPPPPAIRISTTMAFTAYPRDQQPTPARKPHGKDTTPGQFHRVHHVFLEQTQSAGRCVTVSHPPCRRRIERVLQMVRGRSRRGQKSAAFMNSHTSSYRGGASCVVSITAVDAHSRHNARPSGSSANSEETGPPGSTPPRFASVPRGRTRRTSACRPSRVSGSTPCPSRDASTTESFHPSARRPRPPVRRTPRTRVRTARGGTPRGTAARPLSRATRRLWADFTRRTWDLTHTTCARPACKCESPWPII